MDIFRNLHSSVAQTFESSFDDAYKQLNAELIARDARLKEAQEKARVADEAQRRAAKRLEEIENENKAFKEELALYRIDEKDAELSARTSDNIDNEYAPNNFPELFKDDELTDSDVRKRNWALEKKYRELYEQVQSLIGTTGLLRQQAKRNKHKLVQWLKKLERDDFTITLDSGPVRFQRVQQSSNRTPRQASIPGQDHPEPTSAHISTTETSTPKSNLVQITPNQDHQTPKAKTGHNVPSMQPSTSELTESVSTQCDPSSGCEVATPRDDPSDTSNLPTVRTLKRKQVPLSKTSSGHIASADRVPEKPVVIKSEILSSSPSSNIPQYYVSTGTQDLDDIGNTVETPRKRRSLNSNQVRTNAFANSNGPVQPRTLEQDEHSHRELLPNQKQSNHATALQPVDSNQRTPNVTNRRSDMKSRKSFERITRKAIPCVTEDGDEISPQMGTRHSESSPSDANSKQSTSNKEPVQRRLQDLLDAPAPSRSPLSAESSNDTGKRPLRGSSGQKDRQLPFESNAEERRSNSNRKSPLEGYRRSVPADPENRQHARPGQRYRDLPLHRLEVHHFKINSEYNHGVPFAYHSVVRKKDERRCEAGCMRPGCCGEKFQAMARFGLSANKNGLSQEEEDQRLLEEYLGEDIHLLDDMNDTDRANLTHEARAKRMSTTLGKHRHNHQRARSPPGFWETEMPSTQEMEKYREESRKLERQKIEELYREAKRPGGLWKFADE